MSAQHQSDAAMMAGSKLADGCSVPHCDAMAIRSLSDRDFRIDLFRGLSLWFIFLDHIPETLSQPSHDQEFRVQRCCRKPGVLVRAGVGKRLWRRRGGASIADGIIKLIGSRL